MYRNTWIEQRRNSILFKLDLCKVPEILAGLQIVILNFLWFSVENIYYDCLFVKLKL